MIALLFPKIKSSRKVEERSINSVILRNNNQQLVQIGYRLVKPKPKNFIEQIFGRKNALPRTAVFVGNQQTAQTRAANKGYYERALKLSENKEYRIEKIIFDDPQNLLEQAEKGFVFSNN